MRFKQSMDILPGIRIILDRQEARNLSPGVRASSTECGQRGAFINLGFPGAKLRPQNQFSDHSDPSGGPTEESIADAIEYLQHEADQINEILAESLNQHKKIDPIPAEYKYIPVPFSPKPALHSPKKYLPPFVLGLAVCLFAHPGAGCLIMGAAMTAYAWVYKGPKNIWLCESVHLRNNNIKYAEVYKRAITGDQTAMNEWLTIIFDELDWFLETMISFEVSANGRNLAVDVTLPEIKDIPPLAFYVEEKTQVIARKTREDSEIQKDYLTHIHAVALRLAGKVFAQLPTIDEIMFSGYTPQNKNPEQAQGNYILSVIFDRETWKNIKPAETDPLECVGQFQCRRDIQENQQMTTIEPFPCSWA